MELINPDGLHPPSTLYIIQKKEFGMSDETLLKRSEAIAAQMKTEKIRSWLRHNNIDTGVLEVFMESLQAWRTAFDQSLWSRANLVTCREQRTRAFAHAKRETDMLYAVGRAVASHLQTAQVLPTRPLYPCKTYSRTIPTVLAWWRGLSQTALTLKPRESAAFQSFGMPDKARTRVEAAVKEAVNAQNLLKEAVLTKRADMAKRCELRGKHMTMYALLKQCIRTNLKNARDRALFQPILAPGAKS